MVNVVVDTVVVGKVTVVETKLEPQARARAAVPVTCNSKISPSAGEPDKFVEKVFTSTV